MTKHIAGKAVTLTLAIAIIGGCGKGADSFSILKDSADYKQQAVYVPKKIDILWVIDNSGSMATSQNALATNFQSFINKFQTQKYDFHMAVTTTDAWQKQFNAGSVKARLRDGAVLQESPKIETSSGVFVMKKDTPNLANVFATNIKQGLLGSGDERAFESFRQTLLEPYNLGFRRDEAFLAVILVSDEEDFSWSSSNTNETYSNPNLYPISRYVDFLNDFTEGRNYSVSTISVTDAACKTQLSTDGFQRKISTRLPELAAATYGVSASLCSNFGTTLQLISDAIIQLTAVFKLDREPDVSTLKVTVNGASVAQGATNGWTYDAATLSIIFHGTAVPPEGASISVDFYPATIKN